MLSIVFGVRCLRRHILVFQTNVLVKFALISHSRQNKDNCFRYSELSRNTTLNMCIGQKVCKK